MYIVTTFLSSGSRGLSLFLGVLTIGLASVILTTGSTLDGLTEWVLRVFGISFLVLLSVVIFIVFFCWVRMLETSHLPAERLVWAEGGLHAANGAATLALTYTLLGISLGVRTLADQELNTDTVQKVIGGLTEHFSVAFMTTVLGLPTAAGLRALISITDVKLKADSISRNHRLVYSKGEQT